MAENTVLVVPGKKLSVPRILKRSLQIAVAVALTAAVFLVMIVGNGMVVVAQCIAAVGHQRMARLHTATRHPGHNHRHRARHRAGRLLDADRGRQAGGPSGRQGGPLARGTHALPGVGKGRGGAPTAGQSTISSTASASTRGVRSCRRRLGFGRPRPSRFEFEFSTAS